MSKVRLTAEAARNRSIRRDSSFALLFLVLVTTNACLLKSSKPNLPRIFPSPQATKQTGKAPLIIIPGILGSELVNRKTGERLWPELFPADRNALALPIASTDFAKIEDEVVAARVIESAQLIRLLPEMAVYGELLRALESYGGYRRGDLDAPAPDGDRDTFYLFAYDWRRDNVESARRLANKIASLKRLLNKPDLRFDIVAHSMGGLVARYYAMYGDRELANDPQPDWSGARHINRLILFGAPNAGSMDALRTLLQGYSVTEANKTRVHLFRSLGRAMVFAAPSVYQLLPRNETARFFDADLSPIKLDLFDVETWKRYGWSAAFDPELLAGERKSLIKKNGEGNGGDEAEKIVAQRAGYLGAALARAAAFHRALDSSIAPAEPLRLHLVGGDCDPTLAGALIVEVKGAQRTLFYPGKIPRERRKQAFNLMFIPGDGRVTRQSLFGLRFNSESSESNEAITQVMKQTPTHTLFGCEGHGELPINPTMMDNLLTLLLGNRY